MHAGPPGHVRKRNNDFCIMCHSRAAALSVLVIEWRSIVLRNEGNLL
jgi:hypothetical protein